MGESVAGTALKSKLVQSLPSSPSLRTTVPEAIRVLLGLGKGDTLDWSFDLATREVKISKAMADASRPALTPGKRRTKSR
jgi:hypothetical protein